MIAEGYERAKLSQNLHVTAVTVERKRKTGVVRAE